MKREKIARIIDEKWKRPKGERIRKRIREGYVDEKRKDCSNDRWKVKETKRRKNKKKNKRRM